MKSLAAVATNASRGQAVGVASLIHLAIMRSAGDDLSFNARSKINGVRAACATRAGNR